MSKSLVTFAVYCLMALAHAGCEWTEPMYVGTHWTRGTWTGSDRTIEMRTRETPPERVFATALQIEDGPLWTRPAHPDELAYNVAGWNAVLSDENGRILPPETYPDGAKLRVRGLMRTGPGVVDRRGRVLHTLDDEERKRGVFTIEVKEIVVEAPPPASRPTTIRTTVPPALSARSERPRFLAMLPERAPPASAPTTAPTTAPGLQPAMKLTANVISHEQIDLVWTAVPGAANYRLEMAMEDRDFVESSMLDATESWASNIDLFPDRQYYFRVIAFSARGDVLAGSNVAGAKTPPAPPPKGPVIRPTPPTN